MHCLFLASLALDAHAAADREDPAPPRDFQMEDKRGYKNLVTAGPRLLPLGIGGRYVHSLDDHLSVMIGAGYASWKLPGLDLDHLDVRGGVDYQPMGNGLHGMYLGPRAVYRTFVGAGPENNGLSTSTLRLGGVVGWRWVWHPGFSLGGGVGMAYTSWVADAGKLDDQNTLRLTGTTPMVEFTLGYAF